MTRIAEVPEVAVREVVVRVAQSPAEGDVCGSDHRALQGAVDYVAAAGAGRWRWARGSTRWGTPCTCAPG